MSKRNIEELKIIFQETELFKSLAREELELLVEGIETKTFAPKHMFFMPGDTGSSKLYVLQSGMIELYRLTAAGKRLVYWKIPAGSAFGFRGMFGTKKQGNFAVAVEECKIWEIPKEKFLSVLRKNPDIAVRMLDIVFHRLHLLEDRYIDSAYHSVKERLAYFLLNNSDDKTGILSNFSHEEIGNNIGAVRQTVTEHLNEFVKEGVLSIKRKQVKILNRKGLVNFLEDYDELSN